jgi:hypothetical protein
MPETSTEAPKGKHKVTKTAPASTGADRHEERDGYVVPLVGVRVPGAVVNVSFWGGLSAAALLGAIDPPLAVLLGAGVVIVRHGSKGNYGKLWQ